MEWVYRSWVVLGDSWPSLVLLPIQDTMATPLSAVRIILVLSFFNCLQALIPALLMFGLDIWELLMMFALGVSAS